MSSRFTLNLFDAYKAIQMYLITMLIMSIGGAVASAGFDVFTADWVQIFRDAVNVSIISTVSYMIKNYFSDSNGSI